MVNDGSHDDTLSVLQGLARKSENISVLDLPINSGKAEAIRAGILHIKNQDYDYLGYWDADLATPLEEVEPIFQRMQNENISALLCSRMCMLGTHIERKWYRHYLGRVFATFVSNVLDMKVYDTQCGAKIFSKEVALKIFEQPFLSKWIFDVELLFRWKQNFGERESEIAEHPISHWKDIDGSKLKLRDFLKAPLELLKIYLEYTKKSS